MRTAYTDLDIRVTVDDTVFHVLNIALERFLHPVPRHSHGNSSYEIHYIPHGCGKVHINDRLYEITPNTLYVTGPHVEHEQLPLPSDPMTEYCLYFKLQKSSGVAPQKAGSIASHFEKNTFWFGQDTQEIYPLIQQIFFELEHRYTGYMIQVEALLQQSIVKLVRCYEQKRASGPPSLPSSPGDSKAIIVEESFLYEYETLTLENLSRRLGLSSRQTERFIREYYGKTFLQKKTEAKMSMAKIYLDDGSLNISEIADRLGYSAIQHFSYAFKQYYGISASEYRKGLTG